MGDVHRAWLPHLIWRQCSALYHPSSALVSQRAMWANTDGLCLEAHGSQWHVGILQLPWKSWVLWFLYRRSISDPRRLRPRVVGHTHRPLSRAVARLSSYFSCSQYPMSMDVGAGGYVGGSTAEDQCQTDRSLRASWRVCSSPPSIRGLNNNQNSSCTSL